MSERERDGPARSGPSGVDPQRRELLRAVVAGSVLGTFGLPVAAGLAPSADPGKGADLVFADGFEARPPVPGTTLTTLRLVSSVAGTLPYIATLYPLEGEVPAGTVIGSDVDTSLRSSVLSTWPDGSAQVVVLAGERAFTSAAPQTIPLRAQPPAGVPLTAARVGQLVSSIACDFGAVGSGIRADFSAPDRIWWANERVVCARYRIAIGSDMEAVIDIHAFSSNRAFIEVVIENGRVDASAAIVGAPGAKVYAAGTVSVNGVTVATVNAASAWNASHQGGRAWYASAWVGGDPGVEVTHDPAYLQSHPMFWKRLEASSKNFQTFYATAADTYSPWGVGRLRVPGMDGGGDSLQIALLPEEQADYVHSGDRFARRAVLATGLAFHSFAFNWRHIDGNLPLRSQYQGKSTSDGGAGSWPRQTSEPRYGGPSQFDGSHIPATTLVAFLCRPSPCFIELAQKEFAWNHTNYGSIDGWHEFDQVRSRAWRNRNYAAAIFLTPDADGVRKSEYRAVMTLQARNLRRFFDKPWNTLGLLWQYGPDRIEDNAFPNAGVYSPSFQHWFCAMAWHMVDRMKVIRDATAAADWTIAADTIARLPVRIINESLGGEWRKQGITLYLGATNANSSAATQVADHGAQQRFGVAGIPPASFAGSFLNGYPDAGGSNNWQTMPAWSSSFGYDKQFWHAFGIAVERGVSGADQAWTAIYTNDGISDFQAWRQQVRSSPRFNFFPRNKPDTKARSALATFIAGMAVNSFAQYDGTGLNATSPHPTLGTTVRPFQDGRSSSSYQILGWAGKGVYDPIRRRLLLMGTGASDGSGQNSGFGAYQYNTLAIFDESTNAWSTLRAFRDPGEGTGARAIGHIYDGNAVDVAGRRLYKPKFGDDGESYIYVYDLDSGAMRAGIPRPPGTTQQNWAALEFIPTRGAAGRLWFAAYASSDALRIWEYDLAGATWSLIVANAAFGIHGAVDPGGGPMMSYNPRANGGAGGVLVGHRGGAWIANVVGAPALTAIALPPSGPIDIAVSGVVRDPVGSGWLRFAGGSTVHRWNGSAWVAVGATGTGPSGDFVVYPLDEYGAVYIVHTSNIAANPTVGRVFRA